jgi:hypothetical protein
VIAAFSIAGTAAIVENDTDGIFATISSLAFVAYFLWIAAASVALLNLRSGSAAVRT